MQDGECADSYQRVGKIENFYGGLYVEESDGKFSWFIDGWGGSGEEIHESLYRELIKFKDAD